MDGGPASPREEPLRAFGRWLRQARELREVLPEEIAASTRLGPGVIEALEAGDEARLPARPYLVGTLRAYAGAVGLDPDEVVLRWQEAAGEPPPEAPRPAARRLLPLLVAAALVGIVAAMLLGALLR